MIYYLFEFLRYIETFNIHLPQKIYFIPFKVIRLNDDDEDDEDQEDEDIDELLARNNDDDDEIILNGRYSCFQLRS